MDDKKNKTSKKKNKQSPFVRVMKILGTLLLSIFLVVIITCSIFATVLTIYVLNFADTTTTVSLEKIPSSNVTRFLAENPDYDEEDEESEQYQLYYAIKNENKHYVWVDIENIPQHVQDAFVYTEDERFYAHEGVDFKRTLAAFLNIFLPMYDGQFGGSTITQQTIKQLTGDDEREGVEGIERKIREIFRSINVEKTYVKSEILQSYLNIIPLGTFDYEIIGIQAAANFYFGKDVSDLSLAEAASLAGMTSSPAYNNPVESISDNKIRQKYTLDHMLENGAISEQEYDQAINEELNVVGNFDYSSATVYEEENEDQGPMSYFMDAAMDESTEILSSNYGISQAEASDDLYGGGYQVYLTIDTDMQQKVEKQMQTASNFTTYSMNEEDDTLWAGFIAMDYNGNVKAIVGGRDKKTESRSYSTVTNATRSPGSCIKPIASYAPALDQDLMTWSSLFVDQPIEIINDDGEKEKWPVNYSETGDSSNWSYDNLFTWEMLARSLNTLPAQLIEKMTPTYSYNFLKEKLDISTLDEADANYSAVTVGGLTNGLKLEELVGAYMIFGNGGKKYDVSYVSKIEDANGNVVYEKSDGYKQAISEETSYIMNRMMQNVITQERGTGRYAKLSKTDLVGKTGTSSSWYDLSFVGCTPDYVSGIWIGYQNPETIPTNEYQNIGAIWKNIFGDIAEAEEHKTFDDTFPKPETVQEVNYCTRTGKLATNNCSSVKKGYYKTSNVPEYCYGGH